jgi:hypothetical protein
MTSRTLVTFSLAGYVLMSWFVFCLGPDGLTHFVTRSFALSLTYYVLVIWFCGSGCNMTGHAWF